MYKQKYSRPELSVIVLSFSDIVTLSAKEGGDGFEIDVSELEFR